MFRAQASYLKAPYFYENLGLGDSLVSVCDPHKHKISRTIVNPLFSKQSLGKLSVVIEQIVEQAMETVLQRSSKGEPIDVQRLYRCITVRPSL